MDDISPNGKTALGERLRRLRTVNHLSVHELARRAGCSASLVSQVERGITTPSARVLYAIANELSVSLDVLFGPADVDGEEQAFETSTPSPDSSATDHTWGRTVGPDGDGIVQRSANRDIIELATGIRWERLTPTQDRHVDFLEVVYEPHSQSSESAKSVRHDGREYLLVLGGEIEAQIGFETLRLQQGDSLAFDPQTPHQYANTTDDVACCLSVIVHNLSE